MTANRVDDEAIGTRLGITVGQRRNKMRKGHPWPARIRVKHWAPVEGDHEQEKRDQEKTGQISTGVAKPRTQRYGFASFAIGG